MPTLVVMSHVLRPVGPKHAAVYWRRRIVVLLALVAVIALVGTVVRLVAGDRDGAGSDNAAKVASATPTATGAPSGSPSATTSPTASPTASPTGGTGAPACAPAALQVTATADASTYSAKANPKLGMLIRNVGDKACSLDAGSAALELVVVSGSDRIWSSDDCQEDAQSNVQVVKPGAELASSVSWPRQRSAEGCPAKLPEPKAGTYQLTGRVGDITSKPLVFTLS